MHTQYMACRIQRAGLRKLELIRREHFVCKSNRILHITCVHRGNVASICSDPWEVFRKAHGLCKVSLYGIRTSIRTVN